MTKRIEEIKARVEAATEGPWEPFDNGPWGSMGAGVAIGDDTDYWPIFDKRTTEKGIANSFFCAHAREDIPYLLKRIERLEGALKEIANNGIEFETNEGSYIVDSNPIEVAIEALKESEEL